MCGIGMLNHSPATEKKNNISREIQEFLKKI